MLITFTRVCIYYFLINLIEIEQNHKDTVSESESNPHIVCALAFVRPCATIFAAFSFLPLFSMQIHHNLRNKN